MALTTSRSKSVPVFPFYVKAKKKKRNPQKKSQTKEPCNPNHHKALCEALLASSGLKPFFLLKEAPVFQRTGRVTH